MSTTIYSSSGKANDATFMEIERFYLFGDREEGYAFDQRMEYLEDQERNRGLYCYVEITPNIWYHNLNSLPGNTYAYKGVCGEYLYTMLIIDSLHDSCAMRPLFYALVKYVSPSILICLLL